MPESILDKFKTKSSQLSNIRPRPGHTYSLPSLCYVSTLNKCFGTVFKPLKALQVFMEQNRYLKFDIRASYSLGPFSEVGLWPTPLTRRHERPELLRNNDALFRLVVFQDGAHHARGRTHGCVQHVDKVRLKKPAQIEGRKEGRNAC